MAQESYRKEPKCKVCKSPLCDRIDHYINEGKSFQVIANWASEQFVGTSFSKINIRNHFRDHKKNTEKQIKFRKIRGRKDKKYEEPIKEKFREPPKKKIKKNKEKNEEKKEEYDLKNATKFLDTLINKVYKNLEENKIEPTITEAIKAIEIKERIIKKSPHEETLLNFVEKISDVHSKKRN